MMPHLYPSPPSRGSPPSQCVEQLAVGHGCRLRPRSSSHLLFLPSPSLPSPPPPLFLFCCNRRQAKRQEDRDACATTMVTQRSCNRDTGKSCKRCFPVLQP